MNNDPTVKIKEYWDERACFFKSNASTTEDVWLRELEIKTIIETINSLSKNKFNILDVGCGDGYSTMKVAGFFENAIVTGMDYSKNMIDLALQRLKKESVKNITFKVGDVTKLDEVFKTEKFDVVISDRCLINLSSFEAQKSAIKKIHNLLNPDGVYIAIENFIEGHENMNSARNKIGLSPIDVRWHNLFFAEFEFTEFIKDVFKSYVFNNFSSSYYFSTRVIYSKLCQLENQKPDYNHVIHQFSINLPAEGNWSPIRMVIMNK